MSEFPTAISRSRRALLLLVALVATLAGAAQARAAAGELVLVAATGEPDYGEVDEIHHRPAISADGRFVAYVPQSSGAGDPLFLRDMRAAMPQQIVTPSRPTWPGFDSSAPALSDDGRYLAFASEEATLSREDVDPDRDVFRYDRRSGDIVLVSRRSGRHGEASQSDSNLPSISADGRFVAYGTSSSNLAPGSRLRVGGIYRRDMRTEANRLISSAAGMMFWRPSSFSPDISGDGRRVAFGFEYSSRPYEPDHIGRWLRDRVHEIMLWDGRWKRPRLVSRRSGAGGAIARQDCAEASVSGSGRFVAFVSQAGNLVRGDDNRVADVFVRDVRRNLTVLASRAGPRAPLGEADSNRPSISADGRFVAFLSLARLLPADGDEASDVYVKDLRTGRLTLVTAGLGGAPSNGRFGAPAISADGSYVAFGSTSSNLSPEVTTHAMSFFRYQLH